VPAQPVVATPSSELIWLHFSLSIDLYGATQSEPKQGFVLFELTPPKEISFVDQYLEGSEQVLQRPIETTGIIGHWLFAGYYIPITGHIQMWPVCPLSAGMSLKVVDVTPLFRRAQIEC
jgi:hypothetical protein